MHLKNIIFVLFLGDELLDQITKIYDHFKRQYSENITIGELKEYIEANEETETINEINEHVEQLNLTNDVEINLLAHLNLVDKLDDFLDLKDAFQTFDKDNDGFISANDLLELLHSIGQGDSTIDDASEMIKDVTQGSSDQISFTQFQNHMRIK